MTASDLLRGLGVMSLLTALAGCCANSVCDCQDERADALTLQFRVKTPSTAADTTDFAPADVDTVYVVRFVVPVPGSPPVAGRPRRDSVALVRPLAAAANPFVIKPNAPFVPVAGQRLNAFAYDVFVRVPRTARNRRGRRTFALRNIALRGEFEGAGCCTCYRNTYKALTLNGTSLDRTDVAGQAVPVVLVR